MIQSKMSQDIPQYYAHEPTKVFTDAKTVHVLSHKILPNLNTQGSAQFTKLNIWTEKQTQYNTLQSNYTVQSLKLILSHPKLIKTVKMF